MGMFRQLSPVQCRFEKGNTLGMKRCRSPDQSDGAVVLALADAVVIVFRGIEGGPISATESTE
jgi:hypothetical protein